MSLKDSLIEKLEKQVESWESKLESLKAQANEYRAKAENEKATEELKTKTMQRISDLQEDIDAARKRLAELRESGESRVKEIRGQIEDWLNRKD